MSLAHCCAMAGEPFASDPFVVGKSAPAPAPEPRGDEHGELAPGARLHGPAVHALGESTLYIPAGWSGVVDQHGTIVLEDSE